MGAREQVIADDRQRELSSSQESLDAELRSTPHPTFAESVDSGHQQAEHDRTQSGEDALQALLDATQDGRDDRQEGVDDEAPEHLGEDAARARAARTRRAGASSRVRAAESREREDAQRALAADANEESAG